MPIISEEQELLDIIDESDQVIGTAPRGEVLAKRLPHRIVHIFIFNQAGEMALQLRSRTTSKFPGHWTTAAAGHVSSGETYAGSARRELAEEAGLDQPIEFLFFDTFIDRLQSEPMTLRLAVFRTEAEGPFINLPPEEVEEIRFFPLDAVRAMPTDGTLLHPELRFLLEKHFLKQTSA